MSKPPSFRAGSLFLGLIFAVAGCGDDSDSADGSTGGVDGGGCVGPQCPSMGCAGTTRTSLSGTVYNPAGDLPLYNVFVYVPTTSLAPIETGPSCDRCETTLSGNPIVQATTDTQGRFVLSDVPAGDDVPVVIQIGKWRRELTVPRVEACVDTPIDPGATRLPRNQSEGHLPRIALTTGGADALECFLRKVGIDDAEFTAEDGPGRVNLFAGRQGTPRYRSGFGSGTTFTTGPGFWDPDNNGGQNRLMGYDIVLHSCEGNVDPGNKSPRALGAFKQYIDAGGRVFASHWHNYWIRNGVDPLPRVGDFRSDLADPGNPPDDPPLIGDIVTNFPKGFAMAEWLLNVGGSTEFGKLPISDPEHTLVSIDPTLATSWIVNDTDPRLEVPTSIQYISFNTPVEADPADQCGRVVFSDIHVSSGDDSDPSLAYPDGCTTTGLTPEERALTFMLFDLGGCIAEDVPID